MLTTIDETIAQGAAMLSLKPRNPTLALKTKPVMVASMNPAPTSATGMRRDGQPPHRARLRKRPGGGTA
ncbi:MAG: hypothetical protein ACRDYY_02920, partial [Acidimicrobiales bacterium]